MKIQYKTHIPVPARIYTHAENRINELEHLFSGIPEAHVVFAAKNGIHYVELTIFVGSTVFRTTEKTADMMISIDAAVSSIRKQLYVHKDKLKETVVSPDAFESEEDEFILIPEADDYNAPSFKVVRSKQFPFNPMRVEEAILQMNLIGHAFFAFRNADRDNAYSVVYRRNDGQYGILTDTLK
ncbi:MAG: ribosome-associated translation inhibitor RaiA [Ruminiclostridium sp.]|nr:ribosome-associated translation inhibitor RaiA [Ruminiclostridium sp.]